MCPIKCPPTDFQSLFEEQCQRARGAQQHQQGSMSFHCRSPRKQYIWKQPTDMSRWQLSACETISAKPTLQRTDFFKRNHAVFDFVQYYLHWEWASCLAKSYLLISEQSFGLVWGNLDMFHMIWTSCHVLNQVFLIFKKSKTWKFLQMSLVKVHLIAIFHNQGWLELQEMSCQYNLSITQDNHTKKFPFTPTWLKQKQFSTETIHTFHIRVIKFWHIRWWTCMCELNLAERLSAPSI